MNASINTPDQELYLVIEGLTTKLDSLLERLTTLSNAPEVELLVGVDALYRADKDLALLCLRYDDATGPAARRQLIRLSCQSGIPVLDPERLSASDKGLFYQRHLRRYAVRIDDKDSPTQAIDSLGQLLGLLEMRAESESTVARPQPEANTRAGSNRLPSERPAATPREPRLDLDGMALGPAGRSVAKPKLSHTPGPQPAGKRRASARLATIPARPANAVLSACETPVRRARGTGASALANAGAQLGDRLLVQFERGDRWMPARLRNLTLRQIRLAASAAPPLGSTIRVSIELSSLKVTLPGVVVEVINTETSVDGSTSFRVEIRDADPATIEGLTAILRSARSEGLELSPPPPRKNRRFAVTWPIAVLSDGHQFNAEALDISEQGLFLSTTNRIHAQNVIFGLPLDTEDATVQGRARIAREVSHEMAEERNLSRGYGLHIEALGTRDLQRYAKFLVRVRQRSQLHVLVASESKQSTALAHCFQSAGYTVTQASPLETLDANAVWDKGIPDVAVLDKDNLDKSLRTHVESNLEAHGIRMLHVHRQTPTSARHALDHMMSV